ncbi:redox-regulated ATPase YchF [Conexivisphaera calida]|uniref:GTP-binding and nucleic acid-binding protein YchF n=1 Tax=Conexivisphaera calida TaxID=1874277 RepID=A0A4P2VC23_9ARCH|nr:redox-regulated ATPase YchF [Conexivisphaera calida]BBE41677.1 GTP-binding and nucleic acid-binding protein YchF [Conexivisphaera calida]
MEQVSIGLIGKPNSGKSTFFSAATLVDVAIANYPFTTVEPNVGVAYVSSPCVCRELGVKDDPVNSVCLDGIRYIPIKLIDVAGLIPGAARGLGLGNKFLDDVRRADAIIHVVDASGSTDEEGRIVDPGSHDPVVDVEFVAREYELWMRGILEKDWPRVTRIQDSKEALGELEKRLSGLGITSKDIRDALGRIGLLGKPSHSWSDHLDEFVHELRVLAKPMLIAANKVDLPTAARNLERLRGTGLKVVPTSAISELALRKAAKQGLIRYRPGDGDFEEVEGVTVSPEQGRALRYIREKVLKVFGGTGVQQALNAAVFELLDMIVVYPVEDEERLSDKDGHVLPDAYLVRRGSSARDLAYRVHTELGETFLHAVDVRRKMRVGADHVLKNNDVIKIVATAQRR